VATYFGRAAEENRFAQEDRELGLDRIFSFHLPGQELATLVGLSVWNLRLARGFALERPPAVRPVPQLRHAEPVEVPSGWPRDPKILELLAELDWSCLLAQRPGWTWDAEAQELRCPDGRPLVLTSVRSREHAEGRTGIIFCRPSRGCEVCAPRETCFTSWQHAASKHVELSVPTALASKLRQRLARVRAPAEPTIIPLADEPGPQLIHPSLLLPAEARRACRECCKGAAVHVDLELPPPASPHPRLVAVDLAHRQRRRETWVQKLNRYALAEAAVVRLTIEGGQRLAQLLGVDEGEREQTDALA